MSVRRWRALVPAAMGLLLFVAAPAAPAPPATRLRVFAAASLSDAFTEIAGRFGGAHPGLRVELNFAGSQQLASQIEQGAAADVFAAADERWMEHVARHARLAGEPVICARNRLVVIVPRSNPAGVRRLQDLAKPGLKLVLGAGAVPVGRYGRESLARLSRDPAFGGRFAERVLANVVSEEENVKSVAGKVRLGEVDAGIVYRSDVTPAVSRFVRVFEIPDAANVVAAYPIVALQGPRETAARRFIEFVLGAEGQAMLRRHGFLPAVAAEAR